MTHVNCRLTAKNRDQLRNPTLGNRAWVTFTFYLLPCRCCAIAAGPKQQVCFAAIDQYCQHRALSSKPAACCCSGQQTRQTDTVPFHRPCCMLCEQRQQRIVKDKCDCNWDRCNVNNEHWKPPSAVQKMQKKKLRQILAEGKSRDLWERLVIKWLTSTESTHTHTPV